MAPFSGEGGDPYRETARAPVAGGAGEHAGDRFTARAAVAVVGHPVRADLVPVALDEERDWYEIGTYRVTNDGHCGACGERIPGVFAGPAGRWGARRLPVRIAAFAAERSRLASA